MGSVFGICDGHPKNIQSQQFVRGNIGFAVFLGNGSGCCGDDDDGDDGDDVFLQVVGG